ncbi:MAG: hypothetical protein PHR21_08280 [Oscillospiraceae bacterium]|nr:hypothetical protein [Oscillospiraceae bacterium]
MPFGWNWKKNREHAAAARPDPQAKLASLQAAIQKRPASHSAAADQEPAAGDKPQTIAAGPAPAPAPAVSAPPRKGDKAASEDHSPADWVEAFSRNSFNNLRGMRGLQQVVSSLQPEDGEFANDHDLRKALANIVVVAFVGSSGTGKSTQALRVAREHRIDYIIDDGLLIHGSRILAGTSAKRANTKLESVRQALFLDETRCRNMRRALAENHPTTLMILGTSEGMLQKICSNLWLNPPAMLIRIEDVTTEEQRRLARTTRLTEGQHTIPVPSMEIKHEFSGYFQDYLDRFRRRTPEHQSELDRPILSGMAGSGYDAERTVVRPTFSSLGRYSISDEAMQHLVDYTCQTVPGVAGVTHFTMEKATYGVSLSADLALYFGYNAQEVMQQAQETLRDKLEQYTSINILAVNVRAARVVHVDKRSTGGRSAAGPAYANEENRRAI